MSLVSYTSSVMWISSSGEEVRGGPWGNTVMDEASEFTLLDLQLFRYLCLFIAILIIIILLKYMLPTGTDLHQLLLSENFVNSRERKNPFL